jgi:hypothetical protein
MCNVPFTREVGASIFAVIRRAQAAIQAYDNGVDTLKQFAAERNIDGYFQALGAFESALANTYQGLEFLRKNVKERLFEKGDGSDLERINRIYNISRHYDPAKDLSEEHLRAVWLRNDGLCTKEYTITYNELRSWVEYLCKISDSLAKGQRPG